MENANKILELKAVRITPMRQLLLEYFVAENAVSGLSELEKVFPKSDRITMYRTLKTFEEKGILHSIKVKEMKQNMHFVMSIVRQFITLTSIRIFNV